MLEVSGISVSYGGLRALTGVLTQDLASFNKTVRDSNAPAIVVPAK